MTRLAYALLVGIVGAGIVHIVVLFLLPYMAERDAWSRMSERGSLYQTVRISDRGGEGGFSADPLFEAVACRFDLDDGPVRINAPGRVPFWSVSVYNRAGQNIFSLNERSATDGQLDIVVVSPLQMLELRNAFPAAFEYAVFVEAEITLGMAVVRGFVPDATWEHRVAGYLEGVTCTPY